MLKRAQRLLIQLAILALLAAAVLITLLRILLPQTVQYGSQIETLISNAIGRTVTFTSLSARIHGFEPRIRLIDVTVRDSENRDAAIHLEELELGLSLYRSVLHGQLMPDTIVLIGPRFKILYMPGNVLQVGGFTLELGQTRGTDNQAMMTWLLAQPDLQVRNATVQMQDLEYPSRAFALHDLSLDLKLRDSTLRVAASSRISGSLTGRIEIAAQLQNFASRIPDRITSHIRLNTDKLTFVDYPMGGFLSSGTLDLQYQGQFAGGTPVQAFGRVNLSELVLTPTPERTVDHPTGFRTEQLSGDFRWRRNPTAWDLALHNIEIRHPDRVWSTPTLNLSHNSNTGLYRLLADSVDVRDGVTLANLLTTADIKMPTVTNGRVDQLQTYFQTNAPNRLFARGNLHDAALQGTASTPSVAGISGTLVVNGNQGLLRLNSRGVEVQQDALFRNPLQATAVTGLVTWQAASADHWQVTGTNLRVDTADWGMRGLFRFDQGGEPDLFILGEILHADASKTSRYLPAGLIPAEAVHWLDHGILEAQVTGGKFVFRGNPDHFPFPEQEGRFRVQAAFQGGKLNYQAETSWPLLENIQGQLVFDGEMMEIRASRATTLNSEVSDLVATIPRLTKVRDEGLTVHGNLAGDLSDVMLYLQHSPLGEGLGPEILDVEARGPQQLSLSLRIPLVPDGNPVKIKGEGRFEGADIQLSEPDLRLREASSDVVFSESMIQFRNGSARFLGGSGGFSVLGQKRGDSWNTQIQGTGTAHLEQALALLDTDLSGSLEGQFHWHGSLDIQQTISFTLSTDLLAVALPYPAPFGKPANQPLHLDLRGECQCQGKNPNLRIHLASDQNWQAVMMLSEEPSWRLDRAAIGFGTEPELPEQGVHLAGQAPKIDLQEWRSWLTKQEGVGLSDIWPLQLDIEVRDLQAFGQAYAMLGVRGNITPEKWALRFDGPDIAGEAGWLKEDNERRAYADMQRFRFTPPDENIDLPDLHPGQFPALNLFVRELRYGEQQLRDFTLVTTPQNNAVLVDSLVFDQASSKWKITGVWSRRGQTHRSAFDAQVDTQKFTEVLELAKANPVIQGGKGTVQAKVVWPDSPDQFALDSLTGTLSAVLENGTIQGLNPGLGRLFGILSLQRLEKRLTLDFSDVVGKGLVFDKLASDLRLDQGTGQLEKLTIQGPAARISMRGTLSIPDHGIDLTVNTIPQYTSSLPLAATIGSVGLGAAVYVGKQLLEKQIDQLTDRRYAVTGTWDEPVVERLP